MNRAGAVAVLFGGMAGVANGKGPGGTVARVISTSLGQYAPWEYDLEDKEGVIDLVRKLCEYKADELQDLVNGKYGPMAHGILDTSGEPAYYFDDDGNFYPYYYDDDDDDYDDTEDDFDEDSNDDNVVNLVPETFCGLKKSFLYPPEISPQSKLPSSSMLIDLKMPTRHRITAEEAEKNAKELVAEEERIKNKAEKKKLKKKRQKDRKRQQKLEEELKNSKEIKTEEISINECNKKEEMEDNAMGSFMMAPGKELNPKARNKLKNNIESAADGGEGTAESEEDETENVPETNMLQRSMALAGLGNEMANSQRYIEAISFFTEAIKLNPREYRLFGNRSYCYERMLQYKGALNDAEVSLSLMPHWPKGYFRKGKALMGLKRYSEAKSTFEALLKVDETHVDAAVELQRCQMQILLEKRCTRENEQKPQMRELFPRTLIPQFPLQPVAKAEKKKMPTGAPCPKDLKKHDENGSATSLSSKNKAHSTTPSEIRGRVMEEVSGMLKPQPLNLRQLYPIWVGNVTSRVEGKILMSLFEPFGHIHSIRILYDRTCAFINFSEKEAAERAFLTLQGIEVEGTRFILQLRNPEHVNINLGAAGTKSAQKPLLK